MAPHANSLSASDSGIGLDKGETSPTGTNGNTNGSSPQNNAISVVGMSLLFSGEADTPQSFWDLLFAGRSTSSKIPASRWDQDAFYHPDGSRPESMSVQGAHFIEKDIDAFDAPFFSISGAEAASMDPQQRHLLETTYHALENAGITIEECAGTKTSVYTGCFSDDYRQMMSKDPEQALPYATTGCYANFLANRISWFFNLRGTSMNIDTACSSSLVALDLARQSLLCGDSEMAIVPGANLLLHPDPFLFMTSTGLLSSEGRCFSFDERASGYARGEGFAVLILKRVADAIRDNNTIRAVVRSTGSNQDAKTPGITQPSERAQRELIKHTYEKAGLNLDLTRYFEAHGTGTPVGDPIELRALGAVFRKYRSPEAPLYVGSVKSNIGHTEGASGLAGLVKTVLILEKGVIPPVADLRSTNSRIDHEFYNVSFPREAIPWPDAGLRRASVNSFGFGGTNAHVILDDAYNYLRLYSISGRHCTEVLPPQSLNTIGSEAIARPQISPDSPKLVVLSSADMEGIKRLFQIYATHSILGTASEGNEAAAYWDDFVHTMNTKRSLLKCRSFAIMHSVFDLSQMESLMSKPQKASGIPGRLCFVFTGQGAQWARMGLALCQFPIFQATLRNAEAVLLEEGCSWYLFGRMALVQIMPNAYTHADELGRDQASTQINKPVLSQSLCTALQLGLVELLASFGVHPSVVVGHSSGEIAAAYCTGAISFESAMKLAYYRGLSAEDLRTGSFGKGAMLVTALPASEAEPFLASVTAQFGAQGIAVACINGPKSITMSGDEDQIDFMQSMLDEKGFFARKLLVDVAYHSPHMNRIAGKYMEAIKSIHAGDSSRSRRTIMISSVTGKRVRASELHKPQYWTDNLTHPVQFSSAIQYCLKGVPLAESKIDRSHLLNACVDTFIEIGPHSALQGPLRDIVEEICTQKVPYFSAIRRNSPEVATILQLAGSLWSQGEAVKLDKVNCGSEKLSYVPKTLSDLPPYPFDRSRCYWHESRICRNYRLQKYPKLDLLGKRVEDWDPLSPQWKNHIQASRMRWISDHQINGLVLYPAAGMLVMAIEAVFQVADAAESITGFTLTDVSFNSAMQIPSESQGIEARISLRLVKELTEAFTTSYDFSLRVFEEEKVTECCHGVVKIHSESKDDSGFGQRLSSDGLVDPSAKHSQIAQQCFEPIDSKQLYRRLYQSGLEFGPAFQCIRNAFSSADMQFRGEIPLYRWAAQDTLSPRQPHIVHPVTLDGMMHALLAAVSKGGQEVIPTLVPQHIKRCWISRTGLSFPEEDSVVAISEIETYSRHSAEGMVTVTNSAGNDLRAQIEGMVVKMVSDSVPSLASETRNRQQYYRSLRKPDITDLTSDHILSLAPRLPEKEPRDFYRSLSFVLGAFIIRTLSSVEEISLPQSQGHYKRYLDWMKWQVSRAGETRAWVDLANDDVRFASLCNQVSEANSQGKLSVAIGQALPMILRGEIDALEVMMQDQMLKELYEDVNRRIYCWRGFSVYLDALAHTNPGMKILEIGGGTGASTRFMLDVICKSEESPRCSEYMFTDISTAFLESAREEFIAPNIHFKRLDIERQPALQGFQEHAYDLVLAANVLHATANLSDTLRNARSLLKPGGKLILLEITEPEILRTGFIMGLLPGWWLNQEDCRDISPCLRIHEWQKILTENRFSGTDIVLKDFLDQESHEVDIIISTAQDKKRAIITSQDILIIVNPESPFQATFARQIHEDLLRSRSEMGGSMRIISLSDAVMYDKLQQACCIFLQELEESFLYNVQANDFGLFQKLFISAGHVLWLAPTSKDGIAQPDGAIVDGVCRVLHNEKNASMVILKLELTHELRRHQLQKIVQVIDYWSLGKSIEPVSIESDGIFQIERLVEAEDTKILVNQSNQDNCIHSKAFGSEGPLKLSATSPGSFESLCFIPDQRADQPLAEDEVEVKVHSAGLNLKDCLAALGIVIEDNLGVELSGTVHRIGSQNSSGLELGDRVLAAAPGAFATYVRTKIAGTVKLPDSISFEEAAGFSADFFTAYRAVIDIANLQREEVVLIHSGAEGTCQAAIQLALSIGARVLVTVASLEERQLLVDKYNICEEDIFYNHDSSFVKGVFGRTQHGVDVILNSLSGPGFQASWECIAPYGRFIEIGKKGVLANNAKLPMNCFRKNVTFAALDAITLALEKPNKFSAAMHEILTLIDQKKLKSVHPLAVYPVGEIEKAFRALERGHEMGKFIIRMTETDIVPIQMRNRLAIIFKPDKTYLIAGGLGGLGRSIGAWMSERGASNLLLLSRSGQREQVRDFIETLQNKGVQIYAPQCDIADAESLREVLANAATRMPPIAGCIQSSMVLRDSLFENMSFDEWNLSTRPKIQGSWNLHSLLPRELDFFVLLSSINGLIGHGGQANYAAGNTYMDSLARYRLQQGQKAITLDLGVMGSSGFLVENSGLLSRMMATGCYLPLSDADLFALLGHYCNPNLALLSPEEAQVAIGIDTPSSLRAKNIDSPAWMQRPLFRHLHQMKNLAAEGQCASPNTVEDSSYAQRFAATKTLQEASVMVTEALVAKLARSVALEEHEIEKSKSLAYFGVDSLLAVDLKSWIALKFGSDLPVFSLLGAPSLVAIGVAAAEKSIFKRSEGEA